MDDYLFHKVQPDKTQVNHASSKFSQKILIVYDMMPSHLNNKMWVLASHLCHDAVICKKAWMIIYFTSAT